MASEKRLIDAYTLAEEIESLQITVAGKPAKWNDAKHSVLRLIAEQADVDAVEVVRIEEVKQIILQTFDNLIATHRDISNSHFYDPEKHLGIPKSGDDYYGIYADVMEIARRLVDAALNELCSYGGRKDNER